MKVHCDEGIKGTHTFYLGRRIKTIDALNNETRYAYDAESKGSDPEVSPHLPLILQRIRA